MPTTQQLRQELDDDPAGIGYAGPLAAGDDTAVAELLNTRVFRGPVPIIDVSAYCTTRGITGMVEATAWDQSTPLAVRGLCFGVLSILRDDMRLNVADMDDPAFDQMTDALIALGLLTAAQKSDLHALGENRRSRAEVLWGADAGVTETDVARAKVV